jgi:hypothetical protein
MGIFVNGKSVSKLRGYKMDSFPFDAWKVEDGALVAQTGVPNVYFLTKDTYTNFDLTLEEFGFVYFDPAKFHGGFTGDLSKAQSDFMRDSQVPIIGHCFEEPVERVAWKTKPSYGIVPTEDKALNPNTERTMYKEPMQKLQKLKAVTLFLFTAGSGSESNYGCLGK